MLTVPSSEQEAISGNLGEKFTFLIALLWYFRFLYGIEPMSMSNHTILRSYVPRMKLSPPGCTLRDEIHLAPDWYLATTLCFWRLYWNTCICVQAKKCGFVGWKEILCTIPFDCVKGRVELLLLKLWIIT